MQIPEIMIELQRFEELFPLPIQSRQTILALEQPGYFSGRILGSFEDETRYFNLLYDYSQQCGWYVLHQFNVKSQITTPETISKIQAVLQSSVTIEQLVMHLLGENILPLPAFASSNDHYFQAYCHVFEHLLQAELSSQQVIETILYLQKYLPQLTEGDYLNLNWPKYVWYGPMTAAQAGLCLTVMLLHCDVLIFSPNQRDYFQEIFPNAQMVSQVYTLPLSIEVALFPTKKRAIVATSAQQADVLGVLIDLPDPFIKQLEQFDYTREIPKVITLQTQISGLISREDAVVLRFLHHLGYDIISLNPSSRSDVDRYLQEGTMQIHQLPQHWFEYPNPPKVARKRKWWPWQRQSKVGE